MHGNEVARDQMNFLPPSTIALNEKMLRDSLFTLHKQLLEGRYVGAYFDEAPAEHCKSMFHVILSTAVAALSLSELFRP